MADSNRLVNEPGLWARALYNWDADHRTALSFRKGDIVQVIEKLESGWWDAVTVTTDRSRGWIPSNYFAEVRRPMLKSKL
jgi:son of sevenless-like protein